MDSQFDAWPEGSFAFQFVQEMQIFEEEEGDLPQSELQSDGEEGEKPQKSDGDSQGVVQGCNPCHISMLIDCVN